MICSRWHVLALVFLILSLISRPDTGFGQVRIPPPPEQYDIQFRYDIHGSQTERIERYLAMEAYLESLGFVEDPETQNPLAPTDPSFTRMNGTIPSTTVRKVLNSPYIPTLVMQPAEMPIPEDITEPVKVRIELADGMPLETQQRFWGQALERLSVFGFRPYIGYDHQGYTQLIGQIPFVELSTLLKDLRRLPGGWFMPNVEFTRVPFPLSRALPIRLVEVLPEPGDAPPMSPPPFRLPPPPADQPFLAKLDNSLTIALNDPAQEFEPIRVIIIFSHRVNMQGRGWRDSLGFISPAVQIEGQIGHRVTATVTGTGSLRTLASIPEIEQMIAPPSGAPSRVTPIGPGADPDVNVKQLARLDRLHRLGYTGGGLRVALIDTDFTGYREYVGKGLPDETRLIDLTVPLSRSLQPAASQTPDGEIGHGTHAALALALAAPTVKLTLVRVDPESPYQLYDIARQVIGQFFRPDAILTREEELLIEQGNLRQRETAARAEYEDAFNDFTISPETNRRKVAAREELQAIRDAIAELTSRFNSLSKFERTFATLIGTDIVVSNIHWDTGFALNGGSEFSAYLDAQFGKIRRSVVVNPLNEGKVPPMWIQTAGDTRGQAWVDRFRDLDGNGVMEFVQPPHPIPKDRWTRELNFLGFQPFDAEPRPELPAGARLRVTLQWREPRDPRLVALDDPAYRDPLANLAMLLLRQRDPTGESVRSDELEFIGGTETPAIRLIQGRDHAFFERSFQVALPLDGRYALRLVGEVPEEDILPRNMPSLPEVRQRWESRIRVFVEVLDEPTAGQGRPVFLDALPLIAGVGVPGDAQAVLTIGAASARGEPRPSSAVGTGPDVQLHVKPDVLAFDTLRRLGDGKGPAHGTSLATAFGGGLVASLISSRAPQSWFLEAMEIPPGHLLVVPEAWLTELERRRTGAVLP